MSRVKKVVALGVVALLVALANGSAHATDEDAMCRPYFASACSEAIGRWLPRVPNANIAVKLAARTTVHDRIVDAAGSGPLTFLGMRGVFKGTFFVYGSAGPPQGHAVYDPGHRIAYYDEGCCSWHSLVIASNVKPPPKTIMSRSLIGISTNGGIRLGDEPSLVEETFGHAALRPVVRSSYQRTLSYYRVVTLSKPYSACEERTTFLFDHDRLAAIDITDEC